MDIATHRIAPDIAQLWDEPIPAVRSSDAHSLRLLQRVELRRGIAVHEISPFAVSLLVGAPLVLLLALFSVWLGGQLVL